MAVTIQTPYGARDLHVCKDGDGANEGWVELYGCSFPGGQRQNVQQIRDLIKAGTMELDETAASVTLWSIALRPGPDDNGDVRHRSRGGPEREEASLLPVHMRSRHACRL